LLNTEKHLLERLELLDSIPSLRRIGGNPANRSRFIAALHAKASSGVLSEPERIAEAEARMEAMRNEAKQQLLAGPPAAHPAPTGILPLMASHAEEARGRARVAAEAATIRRALAEREARRAAHAAAAPMGSAVGAHQRALDSIARTNGQ
jgi:hypothetical protein